MKNQDPLVSIIIPVYNREKLVARAIDSAIGQTYKNVEVVVVDNCSTDNTWEVLQRYALQDKRVKVFKNEENLGPVKNWIECVKRSSGKYIKVVFSDDWMALDFVEKAVPKLEDNDDIGFAYSKIKIVWEGKPEQENYGYNIFKKNTKYLSKEFIRRCLFNGRVPVSPSCALFRRKDFEANLLIEFPNTDGLTFNRFGAGNDIYIYLKTAGDYKYVYFLDETECYFYAHDSGISFQYYEGLSKYYLWAEWYFLQHYGDRQLIRIFKAYFKVHRKLYHHFYKNVDGPVHTGYYLSYWFQKKLTSLKTRTGKVLRLLKIIPKK
ncbi:glycosyltransferase family 2 protein [Mucilaginibacter myungsuensis]|uniref:Glycosyltransferase family 2 protein n=1 Tax=Mucilaginibacter myungsuensis TaxID=649104 RepID=A0A929L0T1_9SPHI|nr:glycosyltransferase family 2 protein [Mucilaginibacter myungsuensis]MBE9662414.1 glycosyltransferase family 2 protein [Mucilaginibacter myungsuensis]MDN3599149.1 glycosyltransferase family 2 protein [Mucilaginibacter myungsuensis]